MCMNVDMGAQRKFSRPVIVKIGGERTVTDVDEAATLLLHRWHHQGPKRRAAMDACMRAIRGEVGPPVARGAFVAAALEAKVLVAD